MFDSVSQWKERGTNDWKTEIYIIFTNENSINARKNSWRNTEEILCFFFIRSNIYDAENNIQNNTENNEKFPFVIYVNEMIYMKKDRVNRPVIILGVYCEYLENM